MEDIKQIPEKFSQVIRDFLADLTIAFPEYAFLWENHTDDMQSLYEYCLTVYPERFFDILYQNEDIFQPDAEMNTMFLPNVEFKALYTAPGISENTKKALWKYLQLVLVTIISNVKSQTSFGDTASIFEGINEDELQTKLADTIQGLSEFFQNFSSPVDSTDPEKEAFSTPPGNAGDSGEMPSVDELHDHIKGLFDGKIGSLAKEMAEELSGDVMHMFDDGSGEIKTTGDILKKMMKNPKKIMELVKKISTKLDDKMKNGNISKEEIMKEASDLMSKMKGMGDGKEFQDMMQNMMKTMGMGKGAKMDMNKLNMMMNQTSNKERMRAKLEKRKEFVLEKKEGSNDSNEMVFKIPEEGSLEKSAARPPTTDDWLDEPSAPPSGTGKKGKRGKKKGGKK